MGREIPPPTCYIKLGDEGLYRNQQHSDQTIPNQRIINYVYDANENLTSFSGIGSSFNSSYDGANHLTAVLNSSGGTIANYGYDLNGIMGVTNKDNNLNVFSSFSYTYDANGRITEVTDNTGASTGYTYDVLGRLQSYVDGTETTSYTYDAAGHLLSKGGYSYTWGTDGKLAKVTNPDGSSVEFIYNAAGQRVEKVVKNLASTVTAHIKYQYDDVSNKLLSEIDALTNTTKVTYTYDSQGRLYGQEQGGTKYYYNYDGHGNVVSITDWWGATVVTYKYDPWGKLLNKTGTLYNPITYSGYYYDEETGLYYLINRYYDPVDGRFLSRDAYRDVERASETINPYVYVMNDPVSYVDPDGNIAFAIPLLVGGAAITDGIITGTTIVAGIISGIILAKLIATPTTHPDEFAKLKGNQGYRHKETGEIWKKDMKHKDHWDVSKGSKKVKEVDFKGRRIWPNGPKNKNKR